MAATITEDSDLKAAQFIPLSEYDRLSTYERKADRWVATHTRAWTEVKKDLVSVHGLAESDLDDSSELADVVLMKVIEIAYRSSDVEADGAQARRWARRYNRELKTVNITVGGAEQVSAGRNNRVYRG